MKILNNFSNNGFGFSSKYYHTIRCKVVSPLKRDGGVPNRFSSTKNVHNLTIVYTIFFWKLFQWKPYVIWVDNGITKKRGLQILGVGSEKTVPSHQFTHWDVKYRNELWNLSSTRITRGGVFQQLGSHQVKDSESVYEELITLNIDHIDVALIWYEASTSIRPNSTVKVQRCYLEYFWKIVLFFRVFTPNSNIVASRR